MLSMQASYVTLVSSNNFQFQTTCSAVICLTALLRTGWSATESSQITLLRTYVTKAWGTSKQFQPVRPALPLAKFFPSSLAPSEKSTRYSTTMYMTALAWTLWILWTTWHSVDHPTSKCSRNLTVSWLMLSKDCQQSNLSDKARNADWAMISRLRHPSQSAPTLILALHNIIYVRSKNMKRRNRVTASLKNKPAHPEKTFTKWLQLMTGSRKQIGSPRLRVAVWKSTRIKSTGNTSRNSFSRSTMHRQKYLMQTSFLFMTSNFKSISTTSRDCSDRELNSIGQG